VFQKRALMKIFGHKWRFLHLLTTDLAHVMENVKSPILQWRTEGEGGALRNSGVLTKLTEFPVP
jgi:hypothetical protein